MLTDELTSLACVLLVRDPLAALPCLEPVLHNTYKHQRISKKHMGVYQCDTHAAAAAVNRFCAVLSCRKTN